MKARPPLPLIAIVTAYLALEVALVVYQPELAKVVRLIISAALGFFMLRGSSTAIFIWVALSAIAAIYAFVWTFKFSQKNPEFALVFGFIGILVLSQAMYLIFSKSVRAHIASS
jgi:hypothetical protein